MEIQQGETKMPADSIDPRLLSLSMAFVPLQRFEEPYPPAMGLARGTVFPSLDLPLLGEEVVPDDRA